MYFKIIVRNDSFKLNGQILTKPSTENYFEIFENVFIIIIFLRYTGINFMANIRELHMLERICQ